MYNLGDLSAQDPHAGDVFAAPGTPSPPALPWLNLLSPNPRALFGSGFYL